MGRPGKGSGPPFLSCCHPNMRSHPERKLGGRAPPKEACQVSETIKRQGKTSWFRGGRGVEGGRRGQEEGPATGEGGRGANCTMGPWALNSHSALAADFYKFCGSCILQTCVKWPWTLRKSQKHLLSRKLTMLENVHVK